MTTPTLASKAMLVKLTAHKAGLTRRDDDKTDQLQQTDKAALGYVQLFKFKTPVHELTSLHRAVGQLHRRLTQVCGPLGDYEIVLVNDGSRDGTGETVPADPGHSDHAAAPRARSGRGGCARRIRALRRTARVDANRGAAGGMR